MPGLLISVLKPKSVNPVSTTDTTSTNPENPTVPRELKDEKIIPIAWIAIMLEILSWYWCCAATIKTDGSTSENNIVPLTIGMLNYIIGIIFVTLKGIKNGKNNRNNK